jgi:hypothetical protein
LFKHGQIEDARNGENIKLLQEYTIDDGDRIIGVMSKTPIE